VLVETGGILILADDVLTEYGIFPELVYLGQLGAIVHLDILLRGGAFEVTVDGFAFDAVHERGAGGEYLEFDLLQDLAGFVQRQRLGCEGLAIGEILHCEVCSPQGHCCSEVEVKFPVLAAVH